MTKIIITGYSGFVSNHFIDYLDSLNQYFDIIGISRGSAEVPKSFEKLRIKVYQGDLKNAAFVKEIITSVNPDYIVHLASDSSVAYSWENPLTSFLNNTNIFLNVVEAVRTSHVNCRILSVGSSEQYGLVDKENIPIKENCLLNPISPYAVARVSQEMLSKIYANSYGLDIVMTRSFNHIGPGQTEKFVVSSFVNKIIHKKYRNPNQEFTVGNVDIIRDFLDVRDVVSAYWNLLQNGIGGQIYNVCSGVGYSLKEIIEKILHLAMVDFHYITDALLVRPADNPIIIGSNNKLKSELSWVQKISIDQSLMDIIKYWETQIKEK